MKKLAVVLLTLLLLAGGLGAWAFGFEPSRLLVREVQLALPRWHPAHAGLRIALLTDLHVGSPWIDLDKLHRIIEKTNEAAPDLVLITGDLVIQGVVGGRFIEPEAIARELAGLRAPLGVFAVLGNHDRWLDGPRVQAALAAVRITVLEDTAVLHDVRGAPLWIAGVSDYWTSRHDVDKAIAGTDADAPVIVFTHNPDVFPDVPPRVLLTIAGHTHGGQVWLPLFGRPLVPSKFGERYAAGHIIENGKHLYVGTGIGTSLLPVRFRVPPEVRIIRIQPDSALPLSAATGMLPRIRKSRAAREPAR
jgi:predicted MPP superfamily phosphohydrolase